MHASSLGLVLSGGGARGLAHIGVLRALRDASLRPARVAGTSAGALVGLLHCLGFAPEETLELARNELVPGRLARALPGGAQLAFVWCLRSGELERRLRRYVPASCRLEDLPIPLSVCATDQRTRTTCVLERGMAIPAVLASLAVPFVAHPVTIDGRRLVDGSVTNNFPVDVLARHDPDVILGVDVGQPREQRRDPGARTADVIVRPEVARYSFGSFVPVDPLAVAGEAAMRAALATVHELLLGARRLAA